LKVAPTTTVYAGIDVDHFATLPSRRNARLTLGLPDDDLPIVAIVGRINRWKGHDRFLRIARRVLAENAARFVIVGSPVFGCDPHFLAEVDELIDGNIRDFIHFVPWQRDMRSVYAAIDVSCNCSEREPFGRTSLEALASGVPIVCFNDAGIAEIELRDESGVFVEPANEAAFSEAISSYLRDGERLKRAKAAAPLTAAQLDVRELERDFLSVIRRNAVAGSDAQPASRSERVHV
jgi:glycosyltransferase involved in cell wall biosynthesis